MADTTNLTGKRAVLLIGVVLWLVGLLWVLNRKGLVTGPRSDPKVDYSAFDSDEGARSGRTSAGTGDEFGEEEAQEIVLRAGPSEEELAEQARIAALAAAAAGETGEAEVEEVPTYPVWFESERNLGVCKITYEGGSKTANLHVDSRQVEGKLKFSYRCGDERGRGSIDVKPKRVNGVLFCKTAGGVAVKTVRSKDGRCASR